MTARTKIDVYVRNLSMEFRDTFMEFNIFEVLKYPTEDHSTFSIDTIDGLVEEYVQMGTSSANLFDFVEISSIINCFYNVEVADSDGLSHTLNFSNSKDFISDEEKLLEVLRKHKKAIDFTLADLPRINPSICMHKILLEEDT
ncbi:hypothetical protein CR513_21015, partial [Mucuna pruriens]